MICQGIRFDISLYIEICIKFCISTYVYIDVTERGTYREIMLLQFSKIFENCFMQFFLPTVASFEKKNMEIFKFINIQSQLIYILID